MKSPDFEPEISEGGPTQWCTITFGADDLHVVPCHDAIEHNRVGCTCHPACAEVISAAGVVSYVYTHRALDGRP